MGMGHPFCNAQNITLNILLCLSKTRIYFQWNAFHSKVAHQNIAFHFPSKVVTSYNECGQVSAMDQQKLRKSELARNESSITRIHQQRIRSNGTGNEFWTSLQSTQQYNGLKNIKTHLEMHMFSKQNSKSSWTTERSGVDLKTHKNRMQQQQKRA